MGVDAVLVPIPLCRHRMTTFSRRLKMEWNSYTHSNIRMMKICLLMTIAKDYLRKQKKRTTKARTLPQCGSWPSVRLFAALHCFQTNFAYKCHRWLMLKISSCVIGAWLRDKGCQTTETCWLRRRMKVLPRWQRMALTPLTSMSRLSQQPHMLETARSWRVTKVQNRLFLSSLAHL